MNESHGNVRDEYAQYYDRVALDNSSGSPVVIHSRTGDRTEGKDSQRNTLLMKKDFRVNTQSLDKKLTSGPAVFQIKTTPQIHVKHQSSIDIENENSKTAIKRQSVTASVIDLNRMTEKNLPKRSTS